MESAFSEQLVQDDQLRLLFWLSSTELTAAQRLPLALKTLCGMNVDAIARALLSKPETIKKRLTRAKRQLVEVQFEIPCDDELPAGLDRVHQCLYLLFNEGISAHNPNPASRNDICASALGFMRLIISEPRFRNAESLSLTALMHLHYARLPSRFDIRGLPLTLMEQDRSTWLAPHLKLGMSLLQRALDSANSMPSVYLLEALIAFEHCRAKDFAQTQWQTIVQHYKVLLNINPSALNLLSAAVAMTEMGDGRDALALLDENEFIEYDAIKGHYFATLAYINWKRGQRETALAYADKARQAGLPQLDFNTLVRQIKV
jgi:RNA polymerase sigma-70 factor (ECF subfamily)